MWRLGFLGCIDLTFVLAGGGGGVHRKSLIWRFLANLLLGWVINYPGFLLEAYLPQYFLLLARAYNLLHLCYTTRK